MWIWIVSLLVLIACFIFAWRVLVSTYDLIPTDKKFSLFKNFSESDISYQLEAVRTLKSKLKGLEDQNAYYEIQFTKFQQRLKLLEENKPAISGSETIQGDKEDWKELYYDENGKKEKLENKLDETQQELDELREELNRASQNSEEALVLKSDFDSRLNDIQSMQNHIGELQQKLEASGQREKDLEVQLKREVDLKKQYEHLESAKTSLKSENDGLRRQMSEMVLREAEFEKRLNRLQELESKVSLYEEEKSKMIADLEMMVNQSKIHHQ